MEKKRGKKTGTEHISDDRNEINISKKRREKNNGRLNSGNN